jgi:hypothetical protein
MSYSRLPASVFAIFLKRFITPSVYTVCTRTNYEIVSVTNINKYLHHSTSGTEKYVYKYRDK